MKLVLYVPKQLFASVSVNSGWIFTEPLNIHRYSPPLWRILIVKYRKIVIATLLRPAFFGNLPKNTIFRNYNIANNIGRGYTRAKEAS